LFACLVTGQESLAEHFHHSCENIKRNPLVIYKRLLGRFKQWSVGTLLFIHSTLSIKGWMSTAETGEATMQRSAKNAFQNK
jgi:hypothetical protein